MRLVILDDYDKASEWAAKYVRNRILEFNPGPGRQFVLGLPTGTYSVAKQPYWPLSSIQVVLRWECIVN